MSKNKRLGKKADNCLPVFFNICDGMPQRERSDNDICTLFDEMRLPSAETSVFGVVGNALVQRGLAEKVNSYPSTIKKMIAESDKIDIHPAYPDYQITRPSMADGNEPSFEFGLNMTAH